MTDASSCSVRSTCPYCGVGCGVLLSPDGKGGVTVKGDPDHPANFGRLCSKGSALGETVVPTGRLRAPQVNGQETDWDNALSLVADRFRETVRAHGPDSVAFYVSGQLLTEDYYVANKLMKGFIGSANIDTNSRLCMASSVAGHKRAFGTDTVPGTYEDLEAADLIVLVGSNLAWCHPVLYQRILAARKTRGTKIVVIDPRRTASCDTAEMHLPIASGGDVALFNRLLTAIETGGHVDPDFLAHVSGAEEAFAAARTETGEATGLTEEDIERFCKMWIGHEKVVTIYSQGVNQASNGTDKVNAILNCHLATGRIGKEGCGPFSVTGQPNAMGGREVGGLANMLACHLDLENAAHREAVKDFWKAPTVPDRAGAKAVEMFRDVGAGKIKAIWIIHTNPAVSMPDADAVAEALRGCDFVVVSDITAQTDTARLAHVLLPASAWGEKDGTVTNSDRTISRQRPVIPAFGSSRPDWDILADVGRRMGFREAFDYTSPADIFREYAAMSALSAQFGKDFDITGLTGLSCDEYDAMASVRWPATAAGSKDRFFADGAFYHDDGKARMLPVTHRPPVAKAARKYPFRLNTGRIRDQWHTMTRTALSPRLSAHLAEPFVEIHPVDAAALNIEPADLVELRSPEGRGILRAWITDNVRVGEVFAPMHWTGETAPSARIDALVAAVTDPVSGQPESKAAVVAVNRWAAKWYAFAISTEDFAPDCAYWAKARTQTGWRVEMAGDVEVSDWEAHARALFALPDADAQIITDTARGDARIALSVDGHLKAALFVSRTPVAIMRDYLATRAGEVSDEILTGRPPLGRPDPGPVLCSCFGVGVNTILRAIETQGLTSVDAVGAALEAGTNCGSCRPEIAALLARGHRKEAAE